MTITTWILVIIGWAIVCIIAAGIISCVVDNSSWQSKKKSMWVKISITVVIAVALCVAIYSVGVWYQTKTASGIRALTDQKSELANGLDRTVIVYTANGDVIAEYHGTIDIQAKESYVKFDFEGKRYIYYNCFVETIADIPID